MVRVCETRVKPLLVLCPTDTLQNSTKGFQTAARCLNLFLGHNTSVHYLNLDLLIPHTIHPIGLRGKMVCAINYWPFFTGKKGSKTKTPNLKGEMGFLTFSSGQPFGLDWQPGPHGYLRS